MIKLHDVCYVRLGCADLDEMVRFATTILGLELGERSDESAYLRADDRTHNICYVRGDPSVEAAAFEMACEGDLQHAMAELKRAGVSPQWGTREQAWARRVSSFLGFDDPCGNRIELVLGAERMGRRFFPSRDAGITEFGHFALHTREPARALQFWTQVMGARVSDMIGDGALLRIDEVHHKIALFPSRKAGIQHVNFQVQSVDDVMRSWYFLQEHKVPIVFGPGRHPTSTAIFLYFLGPDGRVYEYSFGVRRIVDEAQHVPRHFENHPSSFCMWGAKPRIEEFAH